MVLVNDQPKIARQTTKHPYTLRSVRLNRSNLFYMNSRVVLSPSIRVSITIPSNGSNTLRVKTRSDDFTHTFTGTAWTSEFYHRLFSKSLQAVSTDRLTPYFCQTIFIYDIVSCQKSGIEQPTLIFKNLRPYGPPGPTFKRLAWKAGTVGHMTVTRRSVT